MSCFCNVFLCYVLAARPFIFRKFEAETFANVGSTVSLSCFAAGNPVPTITWSRDGQPLVETADNIRYAIGHDVTAHGDVIGYVNISRVGVADGGWYTCTATNEVGSESYHGRLLVFGKILTIFRLQNKKGSPITCKGRRGVAGFYARHFSVSPAFDGGACLLSAAAPKQGSHQFRLG